MSSFNHHNLAAEDVTVQIEVDVHDYELFGLKIRSDFTLPVGRIDNVSPTIPDVTYAHAGSLNDAPIPDGPIIAEERCNCAIHQGQVVMQVHRGTGGTWIWNHEVGATCHILPHAQHVDVYLDNLGDFATRSLGLILVGSVATLLLHRLGRPSLHASAVITSAGAIAFLGQKGRGKSTMAAGFVRRGARLLTDDILPLSEIDGAVVGHPSLPIMKLWSESVDHALMISDVLPNVVPQLDKKLLTLDDRFAFADRPAPLRALYVLRRFDPDIVGHADVTIERLAGRNGVMSLMAQTSQREYLQKTETDVLLSIYSRLVQQSPIRVISYPSGFGYQDIVQQRILADLRECA